MSNKPKCPNCGAAITCGCQKRTSKDGKQGCNKCIAALNANAKMKN